MTTIATVTLSEAGLRGLTSLIEKLNTRAARHGMNVVTVRVESSFPFFPVYDGHIGPAETLHRVEIEGSAPRINGWGLIARIEFNDLIGNVVRIVPGVCDDGSFATYRTHNGGCDHCNTLRRRNDVFVLEHDNGSRKVVGRNCLADFIRSGDASSFAEYAELFDKIAGITSSDCEAEFESEGGWGRAGYPPVDLVRFLSMVSVVTKKFGWVSRTEAKDSFDKIATASRVDYVINGRGRDHAAFVRENELYVSSEDTEIAEKAVEWVKSVQSPKSEYMATIVAIGKAGKVDRSIDGYAASIIRAYQRTCDDNAARSKVVKTKDYVGCKGERLRGLKVRVVRVRYYESAYGTKTIVAMEADLPNGSVAPITWFASGSQDYTEGADYSLTATVKDHTDDPTYGKQTVISRAILAD